MDLPGQIENKVAGSGLITLDLETFFPEEEIATFDLKQFLFMGLVLKEKDFREALKTFDWVVYQNKYVSIICSADAIVPVWAYMLVGTYLSNLNIKYFFGSKDELVNASYIAAIEKMDVTPFINERVIIKGCSDKPVPVSAYLIITKKLMPVVKSLMYGEACSNVPLYKKKST